MKSIGARTFKCIEGERVTMRFSPSPTNAIGVIDFVFDRDDNTLDRVQNNRLVFTINKEVTVLDMWFQFDPDEVTGRCDITINGSDGGNFPDLARFSQIPPILTYTFFT